MSSNLPPKRAQIVSIETKPVESDSTFIIILLLFSYGLTRLLTNTSSSKVLSVIDPYLCLCSHASFIC